MATAVTIFGGYTMTPEDIPSNPVTLFPFGDGTEFGTAGTKWERGAFLPIGGVITDFRLTLVTGPVSNTITALITNDASNTISVAGLEVTITSGNTTAVSTVGEAFTVNDLDGLWFKIISRPSSTIATQFRWSFKFWPSTPNYQPHCGNTQLSQLDNTVTQYLSFAGRRRKAGGLPTSEFQGEMLIPTAGIIRRLYVRLDNDPGSGKTRVFTVRKNEGATALTATATGGGSSPHIITDVANSFSVAPGDRISLQTVPSGTPTVSKCQYAIVFEPTIEGEQIIPYNHEDQFASGVTTYHKLWGWTDSLGTLIAGQLHGGTIEDQAICEITKLYVEIETAPGFGKTWTFRLVQGGNLADIIVAITGSSTRTGNGAGSVFVTQDDDFNTLISPTAKIGSPNNTRMLLSYLARTRVATVRILGGEFKGGAIK